MILSEEQKIEIIEKEFTSSMLKAIAKQAVRENCTEEQLQIALEKNSRGDMVYKVCRHFAVVNLVKINDLLFINPIYSLFVGKETVEKSLKSCMDVLINENETDRVTVFIMKSKVIGKIRLMLYCKGEYKSELTSEKILTLKNKYNGS